MLHRTANEPGFHSRKGYVLIATTFGLTFILGAVGLSVDIGRMYIAKSEAQAFVDSSALAAASKLDGTQSGINNANSAVSSNRGKWGFNSSTFDNVTTEYATSADGTYTANPPDPPRDYNFVRVSTTVDLPMYLIRVLSGSSANIPARAISGRIPITTIRHGVFPFSPYTRRSGTYKNSRGEDVEINADPNSDPNDPFGYAIGGEYTLLWGAPGDKTDCKDDKNQNTLAENGDVRGYCCVYASASDIREAIVGGNTDTMTIGDNIWMDSGQKNTNPSAIGWRSAQDSDTTSTNRESYKGNGARLVVVPVNGGPGTNYKLVGFAGFLLKESRYYEGLNGNDSSCAIYVGPWTQGVTTPPDKDSKDRGAWVIRLFE